MQNNILIKSLLEIGFSMFESQVYEFILRNYSSKISEISTNFVVDRKAVYRALEVLKKRNLVTKNDSGWIALSPRKIVFELSKHSNYKHQLSVNLEQIIPELEYNLTKNIKEVDVTTVKGKNEFIFTLNNLLELPITEICSITGQNTYEFVGLEFFQNWKQKRISKKILSREISEDNFFSRKLQTLDKNDLRITLLLPDTVSVPAAFTVAGDTIAIWNTVNPKVLIIKDKIIAQSYQSQFDYIWSTLS